MGYQNVIKGSAVVAAGLAAGLASASPEPGVNIFHVGVDKRAVFPSGTYAGQPNPNFDRLTFLLSHTFLDTPTSNHFHRIGAYALTGSAPGTVTLSTNDRIPEPYQLDDGLALLPGTGVFSGQLISGLGPATFPGDTVEQEYGNLTIKPIDNLLTFDGASADPGDTRAPMHPVHYLVNASAGVYKTSIANVTVGLELLALDAGLTVHEADGDLMFNNLGEIYELGTGPSWSVLPIFAVDDNSPVGSQFSATFKLVDLSGTPLYGDSAPFSVDFVVVPEPAAAATLLGLAGLTLRRRRAVTA